MIHDRQGLSFGLETGDDLPGVHARLEDFEGDLAADGLGLLGHEDDAKTALADLLQELVRPDDCAGALGDRRIDRGDRGCGRAGNRRLHEAVRIIMGFEENFHALPKRIIVAAGFADLGRPLRGVALFQSGHEDRFGRLYVHRHGSFLESRHRGQCDETGQSSQKKMQNTQR